MHYFVCDRALYCTNWRATPAKGVPPTLMCRKSAPMRYPETGPESACGEDSAVISQLQQQQTFHTLTGTPHLYLYNHHGGNTCSEDHHRMLATRLGVSKGLLRRREQELRAGLVPFDFGAGRVTVEGCNGAAFTLCGSQSPEAGLRRA